MGKINILNDAGTNKLTSTVYLYNGDYVEAWTGYNGGTPYLEDLRSSFSGYLIG